jgi:hypothetical protein
MRLPRRKKNVPDVPEGLIEARQARETSERNFRHVLHDLIEPLREMREENHITEDVRRLIERRVEGR